MITADPQDFLNPRENDDSFDAEWEALATLLRPPEVPIRENCYEHFQESDDHSEMAIIANQATTDPFSSDSEESENSNTTNDWACSLDDESLNSILATASLERGSCVSIQSDYGDDDILSIMPSDIDTIESEDSEKEAGDKSPRRDHDVVSYGEELPESPRTIGMNDQMSCIENQTDDNGGQGGALSYAQLFFDPETKTLVTVMEKAHDEGSRNCFPTKKRSIHMRNKNRSQQRKTIDPSSTMMSKRRIDDRSSSNKAHSRRNSSSGGISTADKRNISDLTEELEENKERDKHFQDETLSTECSSLSSETFRKHDNDWGFSAMNSVCPPGIARFSDEPIVYSDDIDQKMHWLEEADIDLYLLHDCDDPWVHPSESGANARCGESLKKLLHSSRLCISLAQLGELKWRASAYHNHRDMDTLHGSNHHHKAKLERLSYSILNDI